MKQYVARILKEYSTSSFRFTEGLIIRNGFMGDRNKAIIILRAESKVKPETLENLILVGVASIPVEDKENQKIRIEKKDYM